MILLACLTTPVIKWRMAARQNAQANYRRAVASQEHSKLARIEAEKALVDYEGRLAKEVESLTADIAQAEADVKQTREEYSWYQKFRRKEPIPELSPPFSPRSNASLRLSMFKTCLQDLDSDERRQKLRRLKGEFARTRGIEQAGMAECERQKAELSKLWRFPWESPLDRFSNP
jgi:hypothetical protein